jgi:hypothetical protein
VGIVGTPTTYSIDGSYGLRPEDFGNFTGVTAYNGIRWVAGWSGGPESFGQQLSRPLVPGQSYGLTGWLHQALRGDLAHAGAYEVLLATGPTLESGVLVGRFADTTGAFWEERTIAFTAPADANARGWIIFRPVPPTPGALAYPGLDALNLVSAAD